MIQPIERPLQPLVVAAGQIQAPRYQFASARRLDGLRSGVRAPDGLMHWRRQAGRWRDVQQKPRRPLARVKQGEMRICGRLEA